MWDEAAVPVRAIALSAVNPAGQTRAQRAPSLARARWRLGQVLERQGRKNEAVAELEAAVKMDPDFADAKQDLKQMKKS